MEPPLQRFPLSIKLAWLAALLLLNYLVIGAIALYSATLIFGADATGHIMNSGITTNTDFMAVLYVQAVLSLGIFVLTPMMFSVLEAGEFKHHLRLSRLPSLKLAAIAVCSILIAQFFIPFLVEVNSQIPLPDALAFLKESKTEGMEKALTSFTQLYQFLLVTLVMAIIPAIGEEMLFRGLLLGDMLKGGVGAVVAIIATGLVFALVHLQFKNIIGIWALGSFLGYLYYVSGSLWLPVIVHFTNNFLAVLLKYMYNTHAINVDVDTVSPPLYMVAISFVLFAGCVVLLNKWKVRSFYHQSDYFSGGDEI